MKVNLSYPYKATCAVESAKDVCIMTESANMVTIIFDNKNCADIAEHKLKMEGIDSTFYGDNKDRLIIKLDNAMVTITD